MLTRGSSSCNLVSIIPMASKGWDKTWRRFRSSSICLLSDAMFIWSSENLFDGNLQSKNSEGFKYFEDMLSLINSSVSKFYPGISSRRDWMVKLGVELIKFALFSISRSNSLLSTQEKGISFVTQPKQTQFPFLRLISKNEFLFVPEHFTWKYASHLSQLITLRWMGMFFLHLPHLHFFVVSVFSFELKIASSLFTLDNSSVFETFEVHILQECRRSKCLLLDRHKWMSTFQMFTAEQTQQMNVDVPNVYCWPDTTIECLCSKCLLLNRHNNWMSTFQMFPAVQTQQVNVEVPNVYCWKGTTNEFRRSKCLQLNRHNKWMSTFQLFTAEQTQQMNVDVPNVYCWGDNMNVDVPNVIAEQSQHECRRSKCLQLNRRNKWMSTFQMLTAEERTYECRRSKCLLLNRHNNWMSTFQMFTAEQTQQMNVDDPNVYCCTDTTNECLCFKCLQLNRHNKWMSTFQMFTAEVTTWMATFQM